MVEEFERLNPMIFEGEELLSRLERQPYEREIDMPRAVAALRVCTILDQLYSQRDFFLLAGPSQALH